MLAPFEFNIPGRSTSRAMNLLYWMLISQLLTTVFGATLTGDMKPLQKQTLSQGIKTNVPPDYALSFNITPTGLVSSWSSIIHYTQDYSNDGPRGRIPAVYLQPKSTRIRLYLSTSSNANEFVSTPPLPLNEQTNVKVEAVGKEVFIFYNSSLVVLSILKGDRISGNATVMISDTWHSPANAFISSISMTAISKVSSRSMADFSGSISIGASYEKTFVPKNFALSFIISPTGIVSGFSSIIHFSQDNSDGGSRGRIPALYLYPNSTRLHIGISTASNSNENFGAPALPLNDQTNVRVEAIAREVFVFYNNSLVAIKTVTGERVSGNATVMISDPWFSPANAFVSSISMNAISEHSTRSFGDIAGVIATGVAYEKTIVPPNYALSFNITPKGLVSGWSSIIHYTQDYSNAGPSGRIPGLFLYPNSTRLQIGISTSSNGNENFGAPALPLNDQTNVRVEAVGRDVYIFYNNSLVSVMMCKGEMISGNAIALVSDPWQSPTNAVLSSISMIEIEDFSSRPASDYAGQFSISKPFDSSISNVLDKGNIQRIAKLGFYERTTVPSDYSLSFDLVPMGLLPGYSSILHYAKEFNLLNEWRGQNLAIKFSPNSTNLTVQVGVYPNITYRVDAPALPIDCKTSVRVEAVGGDVWVFYNNSIVATMMVYGARISGNSTLFISSPWDSPADASISSIRMNAISELSSRPIADFAGPISSGVAYEKTYVPPNYALSFNITPTGIVSGVSSIIHYTQDNTNSGRRGRIPAFFLQPNSTLLGLFISTFSIPIEVCNAPALPLNQQTNVRVEAVGRDVWVFYNNSIVALMMVSGTRISGNATLFISNPWNSPANAFISSISMTGISELSSRPIADHTGLISTGIAYEKTYVPPDYALSFNITPFGKSVGYTTIVRYTQDNSHKGTQSSLPSVLIQGSTSRFLVYFSTRSWLPTSTFGYANQFISSTDLPINRTTSVRIEAVGRYMMIFFNNTLNSMNGMNETSYRLFGNATAILSDPWYPAADATISSIRMSSLKTIPPASANGIALDLRIFNSIFDDCSYDFGADAGCGRNLQCNAFSDGKASCGPVANSLIKFLHTINETDTDSIIISKWHQTCGISTRYRNTCSQTTDAGRLTCAPVEAIVAGKIGVKSICLNDGEMRHLQRRIVKAKVFCYSDCSKSYSMSIKTI